MNIVIVELVFSIILLIFALIFFMLVFKYDNIDYDKMVELYRKQKSKVLEEIEKGNKKIDEIEEYIKKYRKKL